MAPMRAPVASFDARSRTRSGQAPQEPPPAPFARGPHILVIDDDVAILLIVRKTLEAAGFEIEVAETSMEGITRFKRRRPDLVLLDVDMPGESGFDTCARLKHFRAEDLAQQVRSGVERGVSAPPIVFLTSHNREEDVREAIKVGGDGYIVKPFTTDLLVAKVRSFLKLL
jgi:two-component system phosphate regulon response regulator PhoB